VRDCTAKADGGAQRGRPRRTPNGSAHWRPSRRRLVEGDDILGDGVNVAARLEGIAEPGGICISEDAFRQVRGKLDAEFEDIGEHSLKNITRPLRVYGVRLVHAADASATALPLPDKPSLAVLPFQNLSGDPDQEYFADGMVEEITTAISRLPWLFVIARNSSFTYKGKAVDVKQVARELGVHYVLEGSAQGGEPRPHQRPADRHGDRGAYLGRPLRRRARGHLRAAGPSRR
jgi:adenylate cyclase